jgi:hypothetical protein
MYRILKFPRVFQYNKIPTASDIEEVVGAPIELFYSTQSNIRPDVMLCIYTQVNHTTLQSYYQFFPKYIINRELAPSGNIGGNITLVATNEYTNEFVSALPEELNYLQEYIRPFRRQLSRIQEIS